MFTGSVNAAEFESPLILPTEIAHTEVASQWAVGHYQNIKQANRVWNHYNIDIKLINCHFFFIFWRRGSIHSSTTK